MPTDIIITAKHLRMTGVLYDTPIGAALAQALPFSGTAHRWGDEIYFAVPQVVQELEDDSRVKVEVGDLAYWPAGKAFCIFFGLTPTSVPGEIRPASAVNLVGRVLGDPCCFGDIQDGDQVTVTRP